MDTYELTFYVSDIPPKLAGHLVDAYDAMTGHEHDGRAFVTVEVRGVDCVSAAKTMHTRLCTLGLQVTRLAVDLVTRPDIAARIGVSRQTVSNWVRGVRQQSFPAPVNPVAGGVWLWGDVYRWAVEHSVVADEGVQYPTLGDLDQFNGWLRGPCLDPWRVVDQHAATPKWIARAVGSPPTDAWTVEGPPVAFVLPA